MTNSNYAKGSNFERAWIKEMAKQGYAGFRMAGSHTECDVILFRDNPLMPYPALIFCQLKAYKRSRPKPSQGFKDFNVPYPWAAKWWVTKKDREGPRVNAD